MKFLKGLVWFFILMALFYAFGSGFAYLKAIVVLVLAVWIIFLTIKRYRDRSKLPGGIKGAALQGIWVLGKNFRFDPVLKKYEIVTVEPKKNYFEFKGNNFRSGDFDEKHKQLPAEYSPFSVVGDNIVIESSFFKNGNWKWAIKRGQLELAVEMAEPKNSKSQFIFYRKNWR